jgi:hypothetical protein
MYYLLVEPTFQFEVPVTAVKREENTIIRLLV